MMDDRSIALVQITVLFCVWCYCCACGKKKKKLGDGSDSADSPGDKQPRGLKKGGEREPLTVELYRPVLTPEALKRNSGKEPHGQIPAPKPLLTSTPRSQVRSPFVDTSVEAVPLYEDESATAPPESTTFNSSEFSALGVYDADSTTALVLSPQQQALIPYIDDGEGSLDGETVLP